MTRGPLVRWYSREKHPDLAYASLMLDKHLVGKLKKKKNRTPFFSFLSGFVT